MKVLSINEKSYEELKLPEIIYKYRHWNDPFHKTIMTNREVYFAKPSSFTDPFDCKIPIRYDLLSDVDIYNHYLFVSKEKYENWSRQRHRAFAREWARKSLIKDSDFVNKQQKKEFDEYNECSGILSLTENISNLDMWKCYSDDHKGFAVGFDPLIMFKYLGCGGRKVIYYDELPIVYPRPKHSFEAQLYLQNFSKLRIWEFEEEYRAIKFNPNPMSDNERIIKIPAYAYKEIIFGAKMDESVKDDFRKSIPFELENVPIKQARFNNDKIEID